MSLFVVVVVVVVVMDEEGAHVVCACICVCDGETTFLSMDRAKSKLNKVKFIK